MTAMLQKTIVFFQNGGYVMWFLMLNSIFVWYFILLRSFRLKKCSLDSDCKHIACSAKRVFSAQSEKGSESYIKELQLTHLTATTELKKHKKVIKTLITVAPLLGLLGTVSGMVETFRSLQFMEFTAQSGGISGGISQALTTTQVGIGIAVPAMIISRILDSREREQTIGLEKMFNSLMQKTGAANE